MPLFVALLPLMSQDGVQSALIPLATLFQPVQNIRIKSDGIPPAICWCCC